jgi:hypothetical protein
MHEVEEKCKMSDAIYSHLTCSGWKIKDARLPSMALIACLMNMLLPRTSSDHLFVFPRLPALPAASRLFDDGMSLAEDRSKAAMAGGRQVIGESRASRKQEAGRSSMD